VDLNMEPLRRQEIIKFNDGVTALPQLRVNGVFVGGGDAVQARH
jgi:glutaredoxin